VEKNEKNIFVLIIFWGGGGERGGCENRDVYEIVRWS